MEIKVRRSGEIKIEIGRLGEIDALSAQARSQNLWTKSKCEGVGSPSCRMPGALNVCVERDDLGDEEVKLCPRCYSNLKIAITTGSQIARHV